MKSPICDMLEHLEAQQHRQLIRGCDLRELRIHLGVAQAEVDADELAP